LRWKILIPSGVIAIVFIILILLGYITIDFGVILTILSLFLPNIIDYLWQPKVSLNIENIKFNVKNINNHIKGHYLTADLKNEGKKICLNLEPLIEIQDFNGHIPKLLCVNTDTNYGQKEITTSKQPYNNSNYAWENAGKIIKGTLNQLRQGDIIKIIFPHNIWFFATNGESHSSEVLLELKPNINYQIHLTVKGEDSEKNSYIKTKKVKIKL